MQAHLPLHTDYFASTIQASYLSPASDAQNYTTGFSRGSSLTYPHPDYRYPIDRGELVASRLCSLNSSLMGPTTLDATGLGFAGNSLLDHTGFPPAEEIDFYNPSHQQQQPWDWATSAAATVVGTEPEPGTGDNAGLVAPAPIYTQETEEDFFRMAKPSDNVPSAVCSPAPQLPTPAAMAVLLNPSSRSEVAPSGIQQQSAEATYDASPLVALLRNTRPSATSSTRNNNRLLVDRVVATQEGGVPSMVPETISREKKHACTMCHKRFDRPSTLRKHLLVHTGEKAFVCDTCGRRFGVASNLNRHVKRCILKPVNTPSPSTKSSPSSPSATMDTAATSGASTVISPGSTSTGRRDNGAAASTNTTSPPGYTATPSRSSGSTRPPGQKRRRRAPSPSQWIPGTLRHFNLMSNDTYRVTSVPLPPVRPNHPHEERDSWDENVGQSPYHPCAWKGILPGPGLGHAIGLGGKDVRNLNLSGRGGTVLGRVLVF